ncbi:MAG: DinB family protein [Ferruginibacter sp.]
MAKEEIITAAEKAFADFSAASYAADEGIFFNHEDGKWSVAENIKHLVISTNISRLAFILPPFIVRWIAGKPNRNSRSYEQLVEKYRTRLAEGGKAKGRFVPKKLEVQYGKQKLLQQWDQAALKFISALKKKRTSETKLDDYLVRHPLLGRITLRELCYFTIYHTEHHLAIIKKMI